MARRLLLLREGILRVDSNRELVYYDDVLYPEGPPEECCCELNCGFCPCCLGCHEVSPDIDLWITGQASGNPLVLPCDCDTFSDNAGGPLSAGAGDCNYGAEPSPAWPCVQSLLFVIVKESGVCKMRLTIEGDSLNSGGYGGAWTAIWEKIIGTLATDCSDLHELTFVSQSPAANMPCDFSSSTAFADITIP